ncbi:MAG: type II toxin-antitoxin system VapC family toxin [Gammaproteobacteria bacterium]
MYRETTIVSYLTARPSRTVVLRAHQQITRTWWRTRRHDFDLFISPLVLQEAGDGDPEAARRRLTALAGIPVLAAVPGALAVAHALRERGPIPQRAAADAMHIAIAAAHGVEYLLTWNCTHIANAQMRPSIERLCRGAGFEPPILCTPEELLED